MKVEVGEFVNLLNQHHDIGDYKKFRDELSASMIRLDFDRRFSSYKEWLFAIAYIKNNTPLKFVFLSLCNYFLGKFDEVDYWLKALNESHPNFIHTDVMISLMEIVKLRSTVENKTDYNISFSITYTKNDPEMDRITGVFKKLEKVRSLSTVQFQPLYSSDFQKKSEFIDTIVYKKPGILIFVGHGGLEDGLILRFSDESADKLSVDEMELLMANLNETSNSGVLLLGCNPKVYLSKELVPGFCRYFVYSDSTSAFSIDVFLDGFFHVYNICFDFKKAFYAGRMALSFWGINEIDYLLNVFDKESGEWIPCV